MKPKLKTATVKVGYWSCGNQDHRHRSEEIATKCIADTARRSAYNATKTTRTAAELASLLARHRAGERQCDLAKEIGITPERMRQILIKQDRIEKIDAKLVAEGLPPYPFRSLSPNARYALSHVGAKTLKDAQSALDAGAFDGLVNVGPVSIREIRQFLEALK